MLDPGRRTTSAHQMNPPDQINEPVPGRLSCDSHVSYDIRDYGNRVRKSAEYYAKFRQSWSGPLVAAAADDDEESEFGFSTPPVWGPTSPSASPLPRKNNNSSNHYRNLSPSSKAQAIARGQRELMEMVSKMPETCYELSLRDLVEQQPIDEEQQKQEEQESEKGVKKKNNDKKMEIVKKKKKNGSVRVSNNNNNEGFLLKMVFPVAFGTKNNDKKKKISELGSYSFKVAPRPPVVEGSDKAVDKEWWKKRFEQSENEISSGSSSSNNGSGKSSVSSNSSSSLSRNSSRHESGGGCLPFSFIRNKKNKNGQ